MPQEFAQNQQQTKVIGLLLALLSAIGIFAMLHHPSIAAIDIHGQINEIKDESFINGLIHGGLIAIIIVISFCLTFYARIAGLWRLNVLLGLICYWLGTIAMINAALISGFVVPHVASMVDPASASEVTTFIGLKRMSWATNQAFANFGSICWCFTMCCWAMSLLKSSLNRKAFALLSLIVGIVLIIALITGWISLTVLGMTIVLVAISVWQLSIAWLLFTHRQS